MLDAQIRRGQTNYCHSSENMLRRYTWDDEFPIWSCKNFRCDRGIAISCSGGSRFALSLLVHFFRQTFFGPNDQTERHTRGAFAIMQLCAILVRSDPCFCAWVALSFVNTKKIHSSVNYYVASLAIQRRQLLLLLDVCLMKSYETNKINGGWLRQAPFNIRK